MGMSEGRIRRGVARLVRGLVRALLADFATHLDRLEDKVDRLDRLGDKLDGMRRARARDFIESLLPRPRSPRRSVLFLHHNYYHFLHLAKALRRRDWDAFFVSISPPDSIDQWLFHGEDANLFSYDNEEFAARLHALHGLIADRFRMVHFTGVGYMSLFPENFGQGLGHHSQMPWDFVALKEKGVKIGYTMSGCNDGIRQSVYKRHKNNCAKCVWELRPDVCSDARNVTWGEALATMCDLVAVEQEYAHEWRLQPFVHREPLTTALDPDVWNPDLKVPEAWRLPRADGQMIVLHGFGHRETRRAQGRDIKGSGAVIAAIDRLRAEGFNVRLEHPTTVHSRDMRFLQVQADLIVDQLVIGRYGAQAREGMMLGKPTICHIDRREPQGASELACLAECPLVDATEETVYPVLKRLLSSPEERERIGRESRAYALKWHGADNLAKRFEQIYDRMMAGQPLNISRAALDGGR